MNIIEQLTPDKVTRPILNMMEQLNVTRGLTLKKARAAVENQINNNHFTFVIYEEDGTAVAIGSLLYVEHLIHNHSYSAYIEDVCVKKDKHGIGYGKELIEHLIEVAANAGCYKVMLCCLEDRIGFYQKCGFDCRDFNMRIDL